MSIEMNKWPKVLEWIAIVVLGVAVLKLWFDIRELHTLTWVQQQAINVIIANEKHLTK